MSDRTATVQFPCPDESVLDQFASDQLTPEDDARVAEHVKVCAACQWRLDRLQGNLPTGFNALLTLGAADGDDPPPVLDRYPVLGRIDAGGMGVVWRVRDLVFDCDLALKVMKARLCGVPDLESRFLDEARICARLTHPSIVPVHALGKLEDGRPYYLMKLVEGPTLATLLQGRATTADRLLELVQIFAQTCGAMGYAHSQGVIHRDLKPANIMVGKHREVQVMDWGLARELSDTSIPQDEEASSREDTQHDVCLPTRADEVVGTLAYMAPEQAAGQSEVDQRSDVFALGAILCEILTGAPPYTGVGVEALLRQAREADLAEALGRIQACGAERALTQLAVRCLSPRREDRPADAAEVAAAVEGYLAAVRERVKRRLWVGLAAFAVMTIVLAVVAFWPASSPPPRDPNRLRVGIKPWVGYTPLAVADAMGLFEQIRPEYVPVYNLEQAKRAIDMGKIDVAMWLVDTHAIARSNGIPTRVVLKLDVSLDADAVVAREDIKQFSDLIGKKVAFQNEEASHFLLQALCKKYDIGIDRITLDPTPTAKEAAERFIAGSVDAAVTYDPHLQGALKVKGAHLLASAAEVPDAIVDVLTVNQDYLTAYEPQVRDLIKGWFKAVDLLRARDPFALQIACKFNGKFTGADWRNSHPCTEEEYRIMEKGMRYSDRKDNLDFFRINNGSSKFRDLFDAARVRLLRPPTSAEAGDGSTNLLDLFGHARSN
jgi:serine/threonine protein kinase